jgi:tRNA-splicing ligase RtcB (3'-phosphate/5'-hydroxy nucleic acid ligase)
MGKQKIKGKDLKQLDFPGNEAKSVAVNILSKHFKHGSKEEKLSIIKNVLESPEAYIEDEVLGQLSRAILGTVVMKTDYEVHSLRDEGAFNLFGQKHIDRNAVMQMESAMRLPVSVMGALMPDAHHGYGLPIGGVLAADNAVIPYGVGLDIGCRMALTIYAEPVEYLKHRLYDIKRAIEKFTHFGNDGGLEFAQEHEILDRPEFWATPLLKKLHGKARMQLGSSGTGNHFVEFGIVELNESNKLGIAPGSYVGLLSHSGSRGMGAAIAQHYTGIAMDKCRLPREVQSLAWLSLDDEAGQEYWLSMSLAGDFAKACHDRIHINLRKALGLEPLMKIENHHNFAWKEKLADGRDVIVHRKGATPASAGELGIIPGSMASPGYIVSGKGNPLSINSASHGAGRKYSRKQARETNTMSGLKKMLQQQGITLIGGSPEESPLAYKDITKVMECQQELVDVLGAFYPKIVRMHKP